MPDSLALFLDPACTLHPPYCIYLPKARMEASPAVDVSKGKSSFIAPGSRIHNSILFLPIHTNIQLVVFHGSAHVHTNMGLVWCPLYSDIWLHEPLTIEDTADVQLMICIVHTSSEEVFHQKYEFFVRVSNSRFILLFWQQVLKGKLMDGLSSSHLIVGSSFSLVKTKVTTKTIKNSNMRFAYPSHASNFQQDFQLLSCIP